MNEERTVRRTVAGIMAAGALAITSVMAGAVATAAPAEAAVRWVSPIGKYDHKPKRWHCAVFGICSNASHYYCGNPKIAYTKPQPCVYLHKDRY